MDYFEQQNSLPAFKEVWPEYKELGSHTLQATLKRVDFGYQRFFKGLAKYPRFKAKRRYRGWTYPDSAGWKVHTNMGVNGQLELRHFKSGPIFIPMRGKARTWGNPTTCTLVWSNNKWYTSITVNCVPERQTHPPSPPSQEGGWGVGWFRFWVQSSYSYIRWRVHRGSKISGKSC